MHIAIQKTNLRFFLQKHLIFWEFIKKAAILFTASHVCMLSQTSYIQIYIARNWLLCNRLHLGGRYPLFLAYYALNRTVCFARLIPSLFARENP